MIYIIFDKDSVMGPREIMMSCGKIEKEKYQESIERGSSFLIRPISNKNSVKISKFRQGEYSTVNLTPGFYEIQYKVMKSNPIPTSEPKPIFLEVEEGKTYYIFAKWKYLYLRHEGKIVVILNLDQAENEKMGMFHLSRNFTKSKR